MWIVKSHWNVQYVSTEHARRISVKQRRPCENVQLCLIWSLSEKANSISWKASVTAWVTTGLDNHSFLLQYLKKIKQYRFFFFFRCFDVSLPVSTWQKQEPELPRIKAWTWATFLLSTHPLHFCVLSLRLGAYLIMINRCLDNQIQHQKVGDDSPRTLGRKQGTPGIH